MKDHTEYIIQALDVHQPNPTYKYTHYSEEGELESREITLTRDGAIKLLDRELRLSNKAIFVNYGEI